MDPHEKKLNPDTWYYSKRCFLALAEMLAKHMVVLKDKTYEDIIRFFDLSETHGAKVPTVIKYTKDEDLDEEKSNVAYEARQLKCLYLRIMGN